MIDGVDTVDVAIVIVAWNSAADLEALLPTIPPACEGIGRVAVVVADNDSSDASVEVAIAGGAQVVSTGRNAGYAAGVNTAIAAAPRARSYLVLNPDVRLMHGSLRALLDRLDAGSDGAGARVGITVPRLLEPTGAVIPSLRRDPTVLRALGEAMLGGRRAGRWPALGELVVDAARYDTPGPADWASGAAMLVSRACLDAVGPWDEEFFMYSEETDFALRARDAGFGLFYTPDAVMVHVGGDAHVSSRLWSMLTVNRVRCYARRHGRVRTVLFRGAVVMNEALRARRAQNRAALASLLLPSRRPPEVRGALR